MALELIKESIKVNRVIGKDTTRTVLDNDIIVPDINPDISRILLLDGDVYVKNAETAQDRVQVDGVLNCKILYLSDDPDLPVRSINSPIDFSFSLDVENARHGMKCSVKCDVEHMEYNLINSRKINVRALISVTGKVTDGLEQEFVNDLVGIEDLRMLRESTVLNCFVGDGESEYTVRESLAVPDSKPAIREILRTDIRITGKDYKLTEDRVIAKGDLNITALYIGDDEYRTLQTLEFEVPFTQFIDVPGIGEDSECEVDFRIVDSRIEPLEDSDGEFTSLGCEVTVNAQVSAYRKSEVQMLSDAFGLRSELDIEKNVFEVEDPSFESRSQVVLKETLLTDEGSPEIVEVFNVISKPALTDCRISGGKITIEGVAKNSVLYIANDPEQPLYCHEEEIPFTHVIERDDADPDMDCEVDFEIDHCSYSMLSGREVELRLVINVPVKAVRKVQIPVISEVTEKQPDKREIADRPGIVLYFAQPGDTVWSISKKYRTAPEDLCAYNNLEENSVIEPGSQILILRKNAQV